MAEVEIQLHPLVILTVSDTIARRTIRNLSGPIAGAILGQQNGREITMEVAFDSKMITGDDGEVRFDGTWFDTRLEQYREVYKNPQLELVGWWTLGSHAGPEARHLPCQMQIQTDYSLESAPLLLFHAEKVAESSNIAGKLPLSIYESYWGNDSGSMEVDSGDRGHSLKFRELRYTIESGESEMISVDYVAKGGGNATAVADVAFAKAHNAGESSKAGGALNVEDDTHLQTNGVSTNETYLTAEQDELLTSLNAKSNAIKMLQTRINLLLKYLLTLPPSYLSDSAHDIDPTLPLDHPILRSISALLARISLLTPFDAEPFQRDSQETTSDVQLISLLSSLTRSVQDVKDMGRKWHAAEPRKRSTFGGLGMAAVADAMTLGS